MYAYECSINNILQMIVWIRDKTCNKNTLLFTKLRSCVCCKLNPLLWIISPNSFKMDLPVTLTASLWWWGLGLTGDCTKRRPINTPIGFINERKYLPWLLCNGIEGSKLNRRFLQISSRQSYIELGPLSNPVC